MYEMYKMFKDVGYDITIKKILEFEHKLIFKSILNFYTLKRNNTLYKRKIYGILYKNINECFLWGNAYW